MAETDVYVFCYDISRDSARRKASGVLEKQGTRVQESVFEVHAGENRAKVLLAALETFCAPGDSVRAYCLTAAGRRKSLTSGGAPVAGDTEFWLL